MKKILARIILLVASIGILFLSLELFLRIKDGKATLINYRAEAISSIFHCPVVCDPKLGWIPKKGIYKSDRTWNKRLTILDNGLRSNGGTDDANNLAGAVILAVGDSFAFGDGVSDQETWPAILEKKLGTQVINAGVFGYGIDQIFLRTIDMVEKYKPKTVIFSFIPDDILRNEYTMTNNTKKPYFTIDNGQLQMHPVVCQDSQSNLSAKDQKDIWGYSYLIHTIMIKTFQKQWLLKGNINATKVHSQGRAVTCILLHELVKFLKAHRVEDIYVLVQYGHNRLYPDLIVLMDEMVQKCADAPDVRIINLGESFSQMRHNDPKQYNQLFGWDSHMSAKGNQYVAKRLFEVMRK